MAVACIGGRQGLGPPTPVVSGWQDSLISSTASAVPVLSPSNGRANSLSKGLTVTDQSFNQLCELFAYKPKGRPLASEEVAAILGIHPGTMAQYRLRGEGPRFFSPLGTRRVWYAESDVLAWLASGAKRSTSEQVAA